MGLLPILLSSFSSIYIICENVIIKPNIVYKEVFYRWKEFDFNGTLLKQYPIKKVYVLPNSKYSLYESHGYYGTLDALKRNTKLKILE